MLCYPLRDVDRDGSPYEIFNGLYLSNFIRLSRNDEEGVGGDQKDWYLGDPTRIDKHIYALADLSMAIEDLYASV